MKTIPLSVASAYIFLINPAAGADIAAGLGAGAISGLMPIIKPIADEAIVDTIKHLKAVISGATCPVTCRGSSALFCRSNRLFKICKQSCQKIDSIGGYELRIRFGKNWSLAKCVRRGIMSENQTPQGRGNLKSIAIYSQEDLDALLKLISLQMAARHIVDTNGSELTPNDLETQKLSRGEAVESSKSLITHIDTSIKENVKSGVYGNQ